VDGTPFGRYRLIELIGRGGMGEVWRAHDTATNNRTVAIKLLPPHLASDSTFVQRFRREADAAAQLNNPHVIPIHNYGEIDGRLYVDMRLIEGRDLQRVLAGGPLEPGRAVRIIEHVAKALHAAHKIGLVHRDVKPSNILLDEDDNAYLIDFGIARAADDTRLTETGIVPGTLRYMAPERLQDNADDEDSRVDIYAMACVFYECLTGRPPFGGTSHASLIAAHLNTPPPRPSSTRPEVSQQFDPVIEKGMAKDPDQRYATTVELAEAARDATTVRIPRPAPTPGPGPRPGPEPPSAPQPTAVPEPAPVNYPSVRQQEPTRPAREVFTSAPPQHRPAAEGIRAAEPPYSPAARWPTERPPPKVSYHHREALARQRPKWGRRKIVVVAAIILLAAAAIGVSGYLVSGPSQRQSTSQHTVQQSTPGPTVLPFTDLRGPEGVAVDSAGGVYVSEFSNNRVVELTAGSKAQTALAFTGLKEPVGVAVDTAGSVYVADSYHDRVVELAAGSSTQTVLPFTGLRGPGGVAVDSAGGVYVSDYFNDRVVELAAGSSTQTVLPFTGLRLPAGVAVDSAGGVYVSEFGNDRVVKLAAGSSTQTVLPFTGLSHPEGVAVDGAGNIYVSDHGNNRVVKLTTGSSTQTVLPFTGLNNPFYVAVDSAGGVYVADFSNGRVVKLAAG
jgi:serine/threonine-protein kinase